MKDLAKAVAEFNAARNWGRYHDPKNLSMALASEAGELCHLFRWVSNDQADAQASALREHVEDEVADVQILLFALADRCGIDLGEVVRAKLEWNHERYLVAEVDREGQR
jgi:NTP pyrophosphatase (non-canonical NTP hydrolase)